MKTAFIILFLGICAACPAQTPPPARPRFNTLPQVAADDKAMPALREWQKKVGDNYKKGGVVIATFTPWYEMATPSLRKLFPNLRFFAISWDERQNPAIKEPLGGMGAGLEFIVVCDKEGKYTAEMCGWGGMDDYGKLLASNKIAIRSLEDADLVWQCLCDTHRWGLRGPSVKISDTTWHLGDSVNDQKEHYYYKVTLDKDQIVVTGTLQADAQ